MELIFILKRLLIRMLVSVVVQVLVVVIVGVVVVYPARVVRISMVVVVVSFGFVSIISTHLVVYRRAAVAHRELQFRLGVLASRIRAIILQLLAFVSSCFL